MARHAKVRIDEQHFCSQDWRAAMTMLDGLLDNLDDVATKLGLPVEKAQAFAETAKEKLAGGGDQFAALAAAARDHGVSLEGLQGLVGHLGEDVHEMLAKATSLFDKDGDGNPLNDLGGIVKGLFGGKGS
jgi:hypothetical protein